MINRRKGILAGVALALIGGLVSVFYSINNNHPRRIEPEAWTRVNFIGDEEKDALVWRSTYFGLGNSRLTVVDGSEISQDDEGNYFTNGRPNYHYPIEEISYRNIENKEIVVLVYGKPRLNKVTVNEKGRYAKVYELREIGEKPDFSEACGEALERIIYNFTKN